jgi:hypothetical protein
MRRISALCAAAGLALAALAAATPASADPFNLIRWEGSGFCQIWDVGVPTAPFPSNYTTVSMRMPTFVEALAVKESLLRAGTCTF